MVKSVCLDIVGPIIQQSVVTNLFYIMVTISWGSSKKTEALWSALLFLNYSIRQTVYWYVIFPQEWFILILTYSILSRMVTKCDLLSLNCSFHSIINGTTHTFTTHASLTCEDGGSKSSPYWKWVFYLFSNSMSSY